MLEKIRGKFKEFIDKDNSKKFITNLSIFICIGIALMIVSDTFVQESKENKSEINNLSYQVEDKNNTVSQNLISDYSREIEKQLKEILSQIKGVGEVNVMVNLEDTAEMIPAFNTTVSSENTNENDSNGGTRTVNRDDSRQEVVTANGDSLMVIKEVKPNVKGVIIVAEGAADIKVKETLYSAVRTVLGISANKVEVYQSK